MSINGDVVEGNISMEENARHKASGYAGMSGLLTVADDSGLRWMRWG